MTLAVGALWKREVLKFVRDRSRLIGALAQPLGFWVLLGLGFQGTFRMPTGAGADVGYLEFLFPGILALVVLFTAIFATISIVEERQTGFVQAALVAPTSRTSLVLGNALGGTSLALVQSMLFLLLLPLAGIGPSLPGLLLALVALTLTGLAFNALGFVIAWRMETTRGFHAIMNLFLLPLWFLSGGFFPYEGAPAILQWLMRLNPVSYAVSGIRHGLYWPDAPPAALASPLVCVLVSLGFAAAMLALAVYTVRKPLY